ncbi:MAG: fluoride efflux transporter CrcB [Alicyclobacillaceae bacterium]|nr:fluoride efflux transporter CrcB [Alicyclobacillaceae bacterium]
MSYVAVAIGGFLGTCARWMLTEWIGTWGGFPIATLLINLSGCFVLAWFYTVTLESSPVHPLLRVGIGTGFIGAFTTYSTFTVDVWKLVQSGAWTMAAGYVITSLGGGLLAGWVGLALASRQSQLRMVDHSDDDVDT